MESEAVRIARGSETPAGLDIFGLEGVMVARTYVMMDYDDGERVASAVSLTPGIETPRVTAPSRRGRGPGDGRCPTA